MATSVELLIPLKSSHKALAMLTAMRAAIKAAGDKLTVNMEYTGGAEWLILYGVGAPERDAARKRHIASGRPVMCWDLAYFHRTEYLRFSLGHDHPYPKLIERTPNDGARWDSFKIPLREDYRQDGHIVLVGLGRKSRAYLREHDWEAIRLNKLRERFPGREIIYRPKPGSPVLSLKCKMDSESTIEQLLRGAFLASCRHSNVACDATVAGVPFEADDGAALYLVAKPYTPENRLDFLRRLAHWQYRPDEAGEAWQFAQRVAA
jgi:hypothetical protein